MKIDKVRQLLDAAEDFSKRTFNFGIISVEYIWCGCVVVKLCPKPGDTTQPMLVNMAGCVNKFFDDERGEEVTLRDYGVDMNETRPFEDFLADLALAALPVAGKGN